MYKMNLDRYFVKRDLASYVFSVPINLEKNFGAEKIGPSLIHCFPTLLSFSSSHSTFIASRMEQLHK